MAYLAIHNEKLDAAGRAALRKLCPFGALEEQDGKLTVNAACKMCGICVKKGPAGACELTKDELPAVNKDDWRGVAVFGDCTSGKLHPVSLELLGKARELAAVTGHPVLALVVGHDVGAAAETMRRHGADIVYTYDDGALAHFVTETYTDVFCDFVRRVKPSAILVGATMAGRSLAPRCAARLGTGLTADCTSLQMKENTDLVQIRPAFGGNIMAQIVTPRHRPQFCTVRYKIFSAPPERENPAGRIVPMELPPLFADTEVLSAEQKPTEIDISEADVIVAAGRGVKSEADLALVRELAELLGAQTACTRPLVENGWFDPRRQIGLSGRTVKPKLIVTVGVSGSVQFCAGMKSSELIVAINSDPHASIFDAAHIGLCGDLYEILPALIEKIKEARK